MFKKHKLYGFLLHFRCCYWALTLLSDQQPWPQILDLCTRAKVIVMFEWAYEGVDHSLPGNGGQDCVDFIPTWQKLSESTLACIFAACCMKYAYKRVTLPEKPLPVTKPGDCGKRILLVAMCLTFGIELGFKFATRQFIWIFNPCHITSMIQVCTHIVRFI